MDEANTFIWHKHTYLIWFRPLEVNSINAPVIAAWRSGYNWNTGSFFYAAGPNANKPTWKNFGSPWSEYSSDKAVLQKDSWSFLALTFDGSKNS